MGWLDSILSSIGNAFGGGGSAAQVDPFGGWDTAVQHAADGASQVDYSSFGDGLSNTDWTSGLFSGGGQGGVDSANPTSFFDPNSVGPPPSIETSGYSLGQVAPNQGSSMVGAFDSPSGGFGGDATDPEKFARQGQIPGESGGANVGSTVLPQPPPTAWESIQQAPGKWWQGVSNDFAKNPVSNSLKVGTTAAMIGAPLIAGAMAPDSPKAPRYNPVAPQPLPGTTGTGRADIPAGSPMSPMLTNPNAGGFAVDPNTGLKRK